MPYRTTHGMSKTTEYQSWKSMGQRCRNPKATRWERYGGRGISICERWTKFENFFADMGKKPTRQHSIERKDNNGPYCPENCIWGTKAQQSQNRACVHVDDVLVQALTTRTQKRKIVVTARSLSLTADQFIARSVINYLTLTP